MPRKLTDLQEKYWLALAFLLRLGFALRLGGGLYQADENGNELSAWLMAQNRAFVGLDGKPLVAPPLTTFQIAVFYEIFGRHPLIARLGLSVLSTAVVWVVGRFVRDITDSPKNGKLALILAAVYPFFIYYGGMLMSDLQYVFFITIGLWLLARGLRERGAPVWESAGAGLALGFAGLCRSEGIGIFLVIFPLLLIFLREYRRPVAVALLFFLLPLAGWATRNAAVDGHWSLIHDHHSGTSLLHGTVVFDQNEVDTGEAMESLHKMPFWQDGWKMPEHEREESFTKVAIQYIRDNPGKYAYECLYKFFGFWRFYPRADKSYTASAGNNPAAGAKRWLLTIVSLIFEPALIVCGLWGLWSLGRRAELLPLWLFLLGTNAVHALTVSQMRYRLPVMPVLMLGFCAWLGRLRRINI